MVLHSTTMQSFPCDFEVHTCCPQFKRTGLEWSWYDKLWKVHPLLDVVSQRSLELYAPHPQISVDESLIGTKSRLLFIHYYVEKKKAKWGIKNWVCADSVTSSHLMCTVELMLHNLTSRRDWHAVLSWSSFNLYTWTTTHHHNYFTTYLPGKLLLLVQ